MASFVRKVPTASGARAVQVVHKQGRAIVAAAPRRIRDGWWLVARTKLIDDLIDAIVTERGVVEHPDAARMRAAFPA